MVMFWGNAILGFRPPEKVLISGGASWLTDWRVCRNSMRADSLSYFSVDEGFQGLSASLET